MTNEELVDHYAAIAIANCDHVLDGDSASMTLARSAFKAGVNSLAALLKYNLGANEHGKEENQAREQSSAEQESAEGETARDEDRTD